MNGMINCSHYYNSTIYENNGKEKYNCYENLKLLSNYMIYVQYNTVAVCIIIELKYE